MDQIYNSMLNMMQAMAERSAAKQPAQTQEKDSFQNQMKQASDKSGKAEGKTETAAQKQPQAQTQEEGQAVAAEDPRELENQMVLAAMAAMQNPVVPVEQAAAPEEAAAETVSVVETVLEAAAPQTAEPEAADTAAILPEEGAEAAVRELPEERFKPVEAEPQAAADTGVEQEAKVTAGESGGAEQQADTTDTPEEGMEAEAPVFRDVREIPVKVGEAPPAAETQEVPVEDQIGPKLTEALQAGDTRVEIQLNPENLGKVTVEVTLHEDGALHVALHAENSQTRGLLERSTDNLMAMLSRDARQEVQVEVPRQEESQQQNFYDGRQGQEHQGRQQQEHRQERRSGGEDFLHQLRLGLVPGDGE